MSTDTTGKTVWTSEEDGVCVRAMFDFSAPQWILEVEDDVMKVTQFLPAELTAQQAITEAEALLAAQGATREAVAA